MVLMMVTTLQSEQRQQNIANISYVVPSSVMLYMEGELILYNFMEEVFQAMFSRNNQLLMGLVINYQGKNAGF